MVLLADVTLMPIPEFSKSRTYRQMDHVSETQNSVMMLMQVQQSVGWEEELWAIATPVTLCTEPPKYWILIGQLSYPMLISACGVPYINVRGEADAAACTPLSEQSKANVRYLG